MQSIYSATHCRVGMALWRYGYQTGPSYPTVGVKGEIFTVPKRLEHHSSGTIQQQETDLLSRIPLFSMLEWLMMPPCGADSQYIVQSRPGPPARGQSQTQLITLLGFLDLVAIFRVAHTLLVRPTPARLSSSRVDGRRSVWWNR